MKKENESNDLSPTDKIDNELLKKHIHFLTGDIDEENIGNAIKWLVYEHLDIETNPNKVLTLYINSDGGYLTDAFALIDVMKQSRFTIQTIGLGTIASAAFLIFACGTKGHRFIARNTSIMSHQFSDAFEGKYHDIKAQMKENELTNDKMFKLLKEVSNLDAKQIKAKLLPPSDAWLTSDELIQFGIADHYLN